MTKLTPQELDERIEWRIIPGFDDYEVSNTGLVRSMRRAGRVLKGYRPKGGYHSVTLYGKNQRVHRLVAMAFLPTEAGRGIVNHKNGKKDDNRVENLEWCTYAENERHSFDVLGKKNRQTRTRYCAKGHLKEGENLRVYGTRYSCLACVREYQRNWYHRRKVAA